MPICVDSEFRGFLFQVTQKKRGPGVVAGQTMVAFREGIPENPAMAQCTSRLTAAVPIGGCQTTNLTTKQPGKTMEGLSEPVLLHPGKLSSTPICHDSHPTTKAEAQNKTKKHHNLLSLISLVPSKYKLERGQIFTFIQKF